MHAIGNFFGSMVALISTLVGVLIFLIVIAVLVKTGTLGPLLGVIIDIFATIPRMIIAVLNMATELIGGIFGGGGSATPPPTTVG